VDSRTQAVPRAILAQLADNQRLVKLLENLVSDVSTAIPDGLAEVEDAANSATALAQLAIGLARAAQELAASTDAGPPRQDPPAQDIPDTYAALSALRDRVATLERAVAELSERPSP